MYPKRCRKAAAQMRWSSRPTPAPPPSPPQSPGLALRAGSGAGEPRRAGEPGRRLLSRPGSTSPHPPVPGAGPPASLPAGCPHGVCSQEAAARAALSLGPARRGRRTWRRGARARAQLRKRRARRPRPAQVLRRRALAASSRPAGAGRAARRGGSEAQRPGQPSRPPWFRNIVGCLTQSAPTWPRLAPSPPGAPRPQGSRGGGVGEAARTRPAAQSGEGIALPGEMPVTLPRLRPAIWLVIAHGWVGCQVGGISAPLIISITLLSSFQVASAFPKLNDSSRALVFPGCFCVKLHSMGPGICLPSSVLIRLDPLYRILCEGRTNILTF